MRIPITRNSPIIKKKALGRHPTNEDALPRVNGVVAKGQQIYVQKGSSIKSIASSIYTLVTAVVLATSASSPFPYKPLQQECQEVGEGIELAIEANVFVP